MKLQTFYPQNPVLKKHIEYYYFLKTDSIESYNAYYTFPHTFQALSIHKNVRCEVTPHATNIFEDSENKYLTIVQGKSEIPLLVSFKGKVNKLTIIFKPLGLNHFIRKPFKEVVGVSTRTFAEWNSHEYQNFLNNFYQVDAEERIILLEEFLMKMYQPFQEEEILQRALDLLIDFDNNRPVKDIANDNAVSTRTLNRLFSRHLALSPIAFRNIARFRHSLKNKLFSSHFKTLTEIGYGSNFYDQSYFIKMYKKLTGNNPSKFFNSIERLADNQLIFEFINK